MSESWTGEELDGVMQAAMESHQHTLGRYLKRYQQLVERGETATAEAILGVARHLQENSPEKKLPLPDGQMMDARGNVFTFTGMNRKARRTMLKGRGQWPSP